MPTFTAMASAFSYETAEASQEFLDLTALLDLQLAPLVGQVDDRQRLHEHRRAAGGDIVDDAAHFTAEVGLDWDDVAAGHDRLLGSEPSRRG